jgi:hypothetical protein
MLLEKRPNAKLTCLKKNAPGNADKAVRRPPMSTKMETLAFDGLVARCLQRNQAAWNELDALVRPLLLPWIKAQLARFGCRDENEAVSILNEVFASLPDRTQGRLRAFREKQQARGVPVVSPERLAVYLAGLTWKRVKSRYSARVRRRECEREACAWMDWSPPGSATKSALTDAEMRLGLADFREQLPPSLQQALRQALGESGEAEEERLSDKAQRKRRSRLREKAEEYLNPDCDP